MVYEYQVLYEVVTFACRRNSERKIANLKYKIRSLLFRLISGFFVGCFFFIFTGVVTFLSF